MPGVDNWPRTWPAFAPKFKEACLRCGRSPESVQLIAVSKKKPPEDIQRAFAAGQRDFGENYAQELRDKRAWFLAQTALPVTVPALPNLHYIGPIQKNKIKYIAGQATLIHGVDSVKTATAIDAFLARRLALGTQQGQSQGNPDENQPEDQPNSQRERRQAVLIQVNIAGEAQKAGAAPDDVPEILRAISQSAHLRCTGLMQIPPAATDPEATRPHFRALRELAAKLGTEFPPDATPNVDLRALSMGMSRDFAVAVEEGATLVRVGTRIFGPRG